MSSQTSNGHCGQDMCSEADLAVLVKACQQPDSYDTEGLDAWIAKLKRVAEIQAEFRVRKLKEIELLQQSIEDKTRRIEDCTENNQQLKRQIAGMHHQATSAPQDPESNGVFSRFVKNEDKEELCR